MNEPLIYNIIDILTDNLVLFILSFIGASITIYITHLTRRKLNSNSDKMISTDDKLDILLKRVEFFSTDLTSFKSEVKQGISLLRTDMKNYVVNHSSLETKLINVVNENIEYDEELDKENEVFKNIMEKVIHSIARMYREMRTSETPKNRIDYKDREILKKTLNTVLSVETKFTSIKEAVLTLSDFYITEFNAQKQNSNNIPLIVDLFRNLAILSYNLYKKSLLANHKKDDVTQDTSKENNDLVTNLLEDYHKKLILSSDPKERAIAENEIERLSQIK